MFNSVRDFFAYIDSQKINYIVLRNYEDFERDDFLMDGHADIDMLCSDRKHLRKILGVGNGNVHCRIEIANQNVQIDIRETGDGYYCREWEEDMLSKKRMYKDICYVMDDETYFYSLIYHALIHKYSVSDEYLQRFTIMGRNPDINIEVREDNLLKILETYMLSHGYRYTYTSNPGSIVNFRHKGLTKSMIQGNMPVQMRRAAFRFKRRIKTTVKKILKLTKG